MVNDTSNAPDANESLREKETPLLQSHVDKTSDSFGDGALLNVSFKANLFSMCAALNSCNLGYDIGVNTGAGPLLQEALNFSDVEIEIFNGSLSFFSIFGALGAYLISDRFGRRYTFVVSDLIACVNL